MSIFTMTKSAACGSRTRLLLCGERLKKTEAETRQSERSQAVSDGGHAGNLVGIHIFLLLHGKNFPALEQAVNIYTSTKIITKIITIIYRGARYRPRNQQHDNIRWQLPHLFTHFIFSSINQNKVFLYRSGPMKRTCCNMLHWRH